VHGARVSLWSLSGSDQHWVRNGFFVRVDPNTEASSVADVNGKFAFTRPEAPNGLVIRAEAGAFAPTEVTLSTAALENLTELVLEMRPGGSIVGRVIVASTESAKGVRLAASRGDLAPRFVTVGDDGTFRFDHVMPGRWLVEQRDPEGTSFLSGGVTIQTVSDAPPELPWNCEVTEGGVTELTLDFTAGKTAILEGSIVVDGGAVPGSVALLSRNGGDSPSADMDAKGHFRLETSRIAEMSILVTFSRSTQRNLENLELVASRELHRGSQELNIALATASLELENVPHDGEPLTYAVKLESGFEARVSVEPEEHGSRILAVPAGHGRLIGEGGPIPWEPMSGATLLELDLKPGEKAHARVP